MKRILGLLPLAALLISCNETIRKSNPSVSVNTDVTISACTPVDYESIRTKVFDTNCQSCHKWVDNYDSVKAKANSSPKGIEAMIRRGDMPDTSEGDPDLTAEQKDLLLKWLGNGAPRTADLPAGCEEKPVPTPTPTPVEPPPVTSPSNPPEPPPVTSPSNPPPDPGTGGGAAVSYETLRTAIFAPLCIQCHQPGGKAEDFDFTSYSSTVALTEIFDTQNPEQSKIVKEVRKQGRGQMPPTSSGLRHLTDDEINQLITWVRNGLPEKL